MQLSQRAIDELKEIYKRKCSKELSNQEAWEMGLDLINLFKVIYRPIPKDKEPEETEFKEVITCKFSKRIYLLLTKYISILRLTSKELYHKLLINKDLSLYCSYLVLQYNFG